MEFPAQLCDELVTEFEFLHPARWVKRTEFVSGRAKGDRSCSYKCCLNKSIPQNLYNRLLDLAPKFKDAKVAEIVINKYDPGDYLPNHLDRTPYIYNCIIQLSEEGDGVTIEETFVPDKKGTCIVFESIGPWHEVKPVKNKRYVLIYLYERVN